MNGVSMDGRLTDDMCRVPAGTFRQGSTRSPDEQPVREVQLSAYAIDRMPVTNRAYGEFIKDGGYKDPSLWTPAGWEFIRAHDISEPNYWHDPLWGHPDVPVTGVSWWEALAYARWCGKTLPTEAQWERACRGAAGSTYPWGEDEPDPSLANYAPGGEPLERRPTRPNEFPRNVSGFGCVDMAGNFAEWCLDNYVVGYPAGSQDLVVLTAEDDDHVVRGGCGLHDEDYLRCAARDHYHPGLRDNLIGFRCVRPLRTEQLT